MSESSDCRAGWCAETDYCAVTCAADVLANKWHPVIVHRLLDAGELGFGDLSDELGSVTNKVLSESLDDLEARDIVERTIVSEQPLRVSYALTERGRALEPVVTELERWGREYAEPARPATE
ncbi:helix-turn-helix domain-containing protein [Haloarculaceae archaeon H-GB2-1]|nr:helix-turn-helix domain-containing protein [Haloarculaceae archaeon H-GB1-1]MEA5386142.1 helix-turn-helix domain-containing protein [Haloarculaceae archaeon H-GB11]MEA5407648.1 helix-turn-helix domain-containing protein [Haloarculaceae archaeon H-GB2-1]